MSLADADRDRADYQADVLAAFEPDLPTFADPTVVIDADPLPVAVYGTLRPGGALASSWAAAASPIPGRWSVGGYRMVTQGLFPYALPANDLWTIKVDLLRPNSRDLAREMMNRLDRIEGVPSHYRRTVVTVYSDDSPIAYRAWLYTPASPGHYAGLAEVPTGDWFDFLTARGRPDDHGDPDDLID